MRIGVILIKASNAHSQLNTVFFLGVPFGAEMRKLDPFEPDLVNTSGGKLIVLLIKV
jgi:hypothetical protein